MKPSLLILVLSLLLPSLFLSGAQGIRFKKGLLSFGQLKIHEERSSSSLIKESDGSSVGEEVVLCKEGHCRRTGMNRKLITTTTPPSSTTNSKNEKNTGEDKSIPTSKGRPSSDHGEPAGEQGNLTTNSPPTSQQSDTDISHNHYVDITDIAEMDYSPATKKPPIHN